MGGETVIFLDGDDSYSPQLLDRAYRHYQHTHADIVLYNWNTDNGPNQPTFPLRLINQNGWTFPSRLFNENLFQITSPAPWNKLYRRDFLTAVGIRFQENVKIQNDVYFGLLTLALADSLTFLDEVLITYNQHRSGQLIRQYSKANINDVITVHRVVTDELRRRHLETTFYRSYVNQFLANCGCAIERGDRQAQSLLIQKLHTLFNTELLLDKQPMTFFVNADNYRLYLAFKNNIHPAKFSFPTDDYYIYTSSVAQEIARIDNLRRQLIIDTILSKVTFGQHKLAHCQRAWYLRQTLNSMSQ